MLIFDVHTDEDEKQKKQLTKEEEEEIERMQARIKPVSNFLMYICVCVYMCVTDDFSPLYRREQQQEYNRDKNKREEEKKGQQAKLAIPNVQKICPPA